MRYRLIKTIQPQGLLWSRPFCRGKGRDRRDSPRALADRQSWPGYPLAGGSVLPPASTTSHLAGSRVRCRVAPALRSTASREDLGMQDWHHFPSDGNCERFCLSHNYAWGDALCSLPLAKPVPAFPARAAFVQDKGR